MRCIRHIPQETAAAHRPGKEVTMKVLLAVDGSDASMSAVAATAALALSPDSSIVVVTVIPDSFAPEGSHWPNVIRMDPPTDRERVRADVRDRLLAIADRLRSGTTTVDIGVLEGRPATEIVSEAARSAADLIVVGARGLSAVRRLLIGSVSSEVVDHAPCPVLIARHGAVERIILATDGSPGAAEATRFVAESGLFDEAEIHVLSVADPGMPWWSGISPLDGATSMELYEDAVEHAQGRARQAADEAAAELRELRVVQTSAVPEGDVVSAILEAAASDRTDLIVVGARNMGTLHRWLVGSVSRSIVHLADASVLVVRSRTEPAPRKEATTVGTA
jgi:nucleotide-binding universal stress UspA family protein